MSEDSSSRHTASFHEKFISESKEKHRRLSLLDDEIIPEKCLNLGDGIAANQTMRLDTSTIDWLRVKVLLKVFIH